MIIIITLGILLVVSIIFVAKNYMTKEKIESSSQYIIDNIEVLKNEGYEIEETEKCYILRKDNKEYVINKYE